VRAERQGYGGVVLIEEILEFNLEMAISREEGVPKLRKVRAAAMLAAGGSKNNRLAPGVVHGIQQHPRAAVGVSETPRGFGERAVGGNLFEEIRAGLGETRPAAGIEPKAAPQMEFWKRRLFRARRTGSAADARGFAGLIHHRRSRS